MYFVSCFLVETISGGNLHIKIKYGIFPVKTEDHDICDVFKDGGSSCPLSPGSHSFKLTASIPGSAPSVRYYNTIEMKYHSYPPKSGLYGQKLCYNIL